MKIKIDRINKFYKTVHFQKAIENGVLSGIALGFDAFEKLTGIKVSEVVKDKTKAMIDVEISRYESILRGDGLEEITPAPRRGRPGKETAEE